MLMGAGYGSALYFFVWVVNRRQDPGALEARDELFPWWVRAAMVVAGAVMVAIAAWMYLAPSRAIDLWPWALTPLTARAVLGTVAMGLELLLIAVARSWNEFDHANVLTYVYVAGLVGTLAAIAVLTMWMRRRIRA
jgi:hypothetical protein